MPNRLIFALIVCGAFVRSGVVAAEKQPVQITDENGKLRIEIDGAPFTEYIYEGASRPYYYPVLGPQGEHMTRDWPMKSPPDEEHDHPHQKSLWWEHGDMNGVDFWSEAKDAGKTVHEKFLEVRSGKIGEIKSTDKYVAKDGRVICTDERTFRVYPGDEKTRIFDFEVTVHASNGDLKFGDSKEGTMGMRLKETKRLKGKVGKGHIVNSEGLRDGKTWGKRADWVDYYGPADGREVGVAIFDHPSNPRHPTWWHVRDYGLFAANPFGQHEFEKTRDKHAGDLTVPAGKSITFKYRFYIHEGDEAPSSIEEAYKKYTSEVK
jgi:hypothetical protein